MVVFLSLSAYFVAISQNNQYICTQIVTNRILGRYIEKGIFFHEQERVFVGCNFDLASMVGHCADKRISFYVG